MVLFYWVFCVAIGFGLGYWVWRKDRKASHRMKWLPALLRGIVGFMISALLLAPILNFEINTQHKPIIVWLQDNSESLPLGLKADTSIYLEKKKQILRSIEDNYELVEWQFGSGVTQSEHTDFSENTTNIQQALLQTYQRYKGSNLGAVILPSDGIYNAGQDPVYAMPNLEVPIYSIGLGDTQQQKDIRVLRIFANKVVTSGNAFEVAADLNFVSFAGTEHSVILSASGGAIQQKKVRIEENESTVAVSFEVKAGAPGLVQYSISVPEAEGERTTLNNSLDFYVQIVDNEVKILVLNAGSHPDLGLIRNALKTAVGYDIDIAAPNVLPEGWRDYQSIIAFQPKLPAAAWAQIVQSEKPVWHILGNLTTQEQIDALKTAGTAEGRRAGAFHSPIYEAAFSAFILPLNAQQVLGGLPPLESSVLALKPAAGAAILMRSKEQKAPMWLVHAGAKAPIAVTAGEGMWRWGIFEYRDYKSQLVTQELIRQTMRSLNVPRQDKPFQVFLSKRMITNQENISFTAELRNKTGELVNAPAVKLVIQDSAGINKEFEMEPFGSSYQLILPAMGEGLYEYVGTVAYEGNTYSDRGTFAVENIPLEQLNTRADFGLLYQLAAQSGGQFFSLEDMEEIPASLQANEAINTRIVSEQKKEPLIDFRWLFGLILLLLSGEWFFRKYNGMM